MQVTIQFVSPFLLGGLIGVCRRDSTYTMRYAVDSIGTQAMCHKHSHSARVMEKRQTPHHYGDQERGEEVSQTSKFVLVIRHDLSVA
jgi:hypothetical protein